MDAALPVDAVEEWGFTNVTNTDLTVSDLGFASPNGSFSAEMFRPGEYKNLRTMYSVKELRHSKALTLVQQQGMLMKGKFTKEELEKRWDTPLLRMARANADTESAFKDPTTDNYYDGKLKELQANEQKEDDESKQGAQRRQ